MVFKDILTTASYRSHASGFFAEDAQNLHPVWSLDFPFFWRQNSLEFD
jgi:hypothetical protein